MLLGPWSERELRLAKPGSANPERRNPPRQQKEREPESPWAGRNLRRRRRRRREHHTALFPKYTCFLAVPKQLMAPHPLVTCSDGGNQSRARSALRSPSGAWDCHRRGWLLVGSASPFIASQPATILSLPPPPPPPSVRPSLPLDSKQESNSCSPPLTPALPGDHEGKKEHRTYHDDIDFSCRGSIAIGKATHVRAAGSDQAVWRRGQRVVSFLSSRQ